MAVVWGKCCCDLAVAWPLAKRPATGHNDVPVACLYALPEIWSAADDRQAKVSIRYPLGGGWDGSRGWEDETAITPLWRFTASLNSQKATPYQVAENMVTTDEFGCGYTMESRRKSTVS